MANAPADDVAEMAAEEFEHEIRDAPRNVEARAQQEAKWAGDYDGRQHWSLREGYHRFRDKLQMAQEDLYRIQCLLDAHFSDQHPFGAVDLSVLARVADFAFGQGQAVEFLANWRQAPPEPHPAIKFAARKRPMQAFEVDAGDWDCVGLEEQGALGRLICHDGRIHRTGRRLEMTHRNYVLDCVYGPEVSDDSFYSDAVQPLVRLVLGGNDATVICYGQTGTGKTHTFNACWQRVGADLIGQKIHITFFEIHGKQCYDLLHNRKRVALRADASERVHVRGATTLTITPSGAADLGEVLAEALLLRKAQATERNPLSSRSHAVCVLDVEGLGSLRFVDLAGSERNYETLQMTAQQHRDFVEINSSLMALKECFRAQGQLAHQIRTRRAFRASHLTQVLRSCFTDPQHKTLILATVSPTATDLLHSMNSLTQVTQMSKELSEARSECVVELPLLTFTASTPIWEWTTEDVDSWVKTVDGGRFKYLVLPPNVTGAMLLKLSSQGLADLFDASMRAARNDREGEAWNEAARSVAGMRAGKLLFEAVRREAIRWEGGTKLLDQISQRTSNAWN